MTEYGILLKGIGSFYEVLTDEGEAVTCKARGAFRREGLVPTVGDRVGIERQQSGYAQLCEILPRRNLSVRPAVANIDQLLIVVSASAPAPDWMLVDRLIIAAKRMGVTPIPVLNKIDAGTDAVKQTFLREYHAFDTLTVSAETGEGLDALKETLHNKVTCFAGQSAVGKSSLLNALFPDLHLETGGLSEKTERGRHTTRHAELWPYARYAGVFAVRNGVSRTGRAGCMLPGISARVPLPFPRLHAHQRTGLRREAAACERRAHRKTL